MSVTWNTADDVLEDLARVTGVRAAFDSSCFVRGHKPPPARADVIDDEEIIQRFGKVGDISEPLPEKYNTDFALITEMIRTVENHKVSEITEKLDSLNAKPAKVIVSKLNPNVSEFVPKRVVSSMRRKENTIENKSGNPTSPPLPEKENNKIGNSSSPLLLEKENNKSCNSTPPPLLEKEIMYRNRLPNGAVKPVKCDDKPTAIAALREKIIETAKANTHKEKKERNVAIAALLRLNSTPNVEEHIDIQPMESKTSQASGHSKIVLLTPDYYQSHLQGETPSTTKCEGKQDVPLTTPEALLENDSDPGPFQRSLILENYSEIKESKAKVDGWFARNENVNISKAVEEKVQDKVVSPEPKKREETPKKKELGPPLETIVFRPKTLTNSSIANSSSSSPASTPKPTGPRTFVPSQRALELARKYEENKERSQALAKQRMGLWDRVECELKERDEIIKKKLEEQSQGSPTSVSSSGSKKRIFP